MPAAPSEIPPKPKIAATMATIIKIIVQRNIVLFLKVSRIKVYNFYIVFKEFKRYTFILGYIFDFSLSI